VDTILLGIHSPTSNPFCLIIGINHFQNPILFALLCLLRCNLAWNKPAKLQFLVKLRDGWNELLIQLLDSLDTDNQVHGEHTSQVSLKLNNLLPRVDFQYNFLTQEPLILNTYTDSNYKVGLGISMPLFLRKERGDLTLAKIKLKETEYKLTTTEIGLKNKRDQLLNASKSYTKQFDIVNNLVKDYTLLLTAEERKFDLGESSIFLINSRESKLIDVKLKAIDIEYGTLSLKADLFKFYALN